MRAPEGTMRDGHYTANSEAERRHCFICGEKKWDLFSGALEFTAVSNGVGISLKLTVLPEADTLLCYRFTCRTCLSKKLKDMGAWQAVEQLGKNGQQLHQMPAGQELESK